MFVAVRRDSPAAYGSGVLLEGMLYWPIRELIKLRNVDVYLISTLALLPLAEAREAEKKLAELIDTLIKRVQP